MTAATTTTPDTRVRVSLTRADATTLISQRWWNALREIRAYRRPPTADYPVALLHRRTHAIVRSLLADDVVLPREFAGGLHSSENHEGLPITREAWTLLGQILDQLDAPAKARQTVRALMAGRGTSA